MKKKTLFTVLFAVLINACSQVPIITTEIPTQPPSTLTPTSFSTPASTLPPTLAPTFTPTPVCHPGNVIKGVDNTNIPPYLNILQVSTELSNMLGTYQTTKFDNLKAVFTVKSIPDQISFTIPVSSQGQAELSWAVLIDLDNNKDTGWGFPLEQRFSPGYENVLMATYYPRPGQVTGDIQSLEGHFSVLNWQMKANGSFNNAKTGYRDSQDNIKIDKENNTITITGYVPGITADSYLSFFDWNLPTAGDSLCVR